MYQFNKQSENQAIYLPCSPVNIKLDNIKHWGRINEAVAQHVISVGVFVLIMDMQTKTNASINQTWYLIQDIKLVDMW